MRQIRLSTDQSADSVQVESAHNWLFGRPQRLAEDEAPGSLTDLEGF